MSLDTNENSSTRMESRDPPTNLISSDASDSDTNFDCESISDTDSDLSLSEDNDESNSLGTRILSPPKTTSRYDSLSLLRQQPTDLIVNEITQLLLSTIDMASSDSHCIVVEDVYYLACALYMCAELPCQREISDLLTPDTFRLLLHWSTSQSPRSLSKRAICRLLCSMFALKPEMYVGLLENMGIISSQDSSMEGNVEPFYVFRHVNQSSVSFQPPFAANRLTVDGFASMTNEQYATLAQISQSYLSGIQLMNSGFLAQLVDVIIDFCVVKKDSEETKNNEKRNKQTEIICSILSFFTELCWDGRIRTWLASNDLVVLWGRLLEYLFSDSVTANSTNVCAIRKLQDATISFLSTCCSCYPANLKKLAHALLGTIPGSIERADNQTQISDFGRRTVVELIVPTERVYVSLKTDLLETLSNTEKAVQLPPPNYPPSSNHQLLYLNTNWNCVDILAEVLGEDHKIVKQVKKLAVAANAKGRDSDSYPNRKKFKVDASSRLKLWDPSEARFVDIDQNASISNMLSILFSGGNCLETPVIQLLLTESEGLDCVYRENLRPTLSLLKAFTELNGFECMATHAYKSNEQKICRRHAVTVEQMRHFTIDLGLIRQAMLTHQGGTGYVPIAPHRFQLQVRQPATPLAVSISSVENRSSNTIELLEKWSTIPLHALIMYAHCLNLTEYLNEVQQTSALQPLSGLRSDHFFDVGKNKELFSRDPTKLSNPLASLPLEILYKCFKRANGYAEVKSNEGNIRSRAISLGIMDTVFTCLAIFTHQLDETSTKREEDGRNRVVSTALKQSTLSGSRNKRSTNVVARNHSLVLWEASHNYSDETRRRVKQDEESVEAIFRILASYINPNAKLYGSYAKYADEICGMKLESSPYLPRSFLDAIESSCLMSTIVDYLRNDSIMDILRHVSLYSALMQLLRCIASNTQTIKYLLNDDHPFAQCSSWKDTHSTSLNQLLQNMKICADIYCNGVAKNTDSDSPSSSTERINDEGEKLVADIQQTANIISIIAQRFTLIADVDRKRNCVSDIPTSIIMPSEERYLRIMKKLRFGTCDIIADKNDDTLVSFNVTYSFGSLARRTVTCHPSRMRRLTQESISLSSSLPVTYSSTVFVRCDTNRLDIMKVLITGPAGTPYMNGCFEFDVYFPPDYPIAPVQVKFVTTGNQNVTFHPHLKRNGMICLSLLNTWRGRPEEMWNSQTSSLLQVLISIQALIFVPDPFVNGFGTLNGTGEWSKYNSELLPSTVKWAMLEQILNPSPCFKEIIHSHFWLKKNEIRRQVTKWINDESTDVIKNQLSIHFQRLSQELNKLLPPAGL